MFGEGCSACNRYHAKEIEIRTCFKLLRDVVLRSATGNRFKRSDIGGLWKRLWNTSKEEVRLLYHILQSNMAIQELCDLEKGHTELELESMFKTSYKRNVPTKTVLQLVGYVEFRAANGEIEAKRVLQNSRLILNLINKVKVGKALVPELEDFARHLLQQYNQLEQPDKSAFETVQKLSSVEDIPTDLGTCLLYTSPSPRDRQKSRMPSSA